MIIAEAALLFECPRKSCQQPPGSKCKARLVDQYGRRRGGGGMHYERYRLGAQEVKRRKESGEP